MESWARCVEWTRCIMGSLRPADSWLPSMRLLYLSLSYSIRHVAAFLALCQLQSTHHSTLLLAAFMYLFSGLGVTAGVHRYWTHHSYEATPTMELLLLCMFAIADQGSVIGWALTHAVHHRYSDTDHDPHNRTAGFWYSHMAWVFDNRKFVLPQEEIDRVSLRLSPLVRCHDACSAWLDPLLSLGAPMLIASLWGDAYGGLMVAGALRWCLVLHATFTVNSLAHGIRPDGTFGPIDSLVVSIITLGEGWHEWHHKYPFDYAAADSSRLLWNPTKVFIDCCATAGLCSRRRVRGGTCL